MDINKKVGIETSNDRKLTAKNKSAVTWWDDQSVKLHLYYMFYFGSYCLLHARSCGNFQETAEPTKLDFSIRGNARILFFVRISV